MSDLFKFLRFAGGSNSIVLRPWWKRWASQSERIPVPICFELLPSSQENFSPPSASADGKKVQAASCLQVKESRHELFFWIVVQTYIFEYAESVFFIKAFWCLSRLAEVIRTSNPRILRNLAQFRSTNPWKSCKFEQYVLGVLVLNHILLYVRHVYNMNLAAIFLLWWQRPPNSRATRLLFLFAWGMTCQSTKTQICEQRQRWRNRCQPSPRCRCVRNPREWRRGVWGGKRMTSLSKHRDSFNPKQRDDSMEFNVSKISTTQKRSLNLQGNLHVAYLPHTVMAEPPTQLAPYLPGTPAGSAPKMKLKEFGRGGNQLMGLWVFQSFLIK